MSIKLDSYDVKAMIRDFACGLVGGNYFVDCWVGIDSDIDTYRAAGFDDEPGSALRSRIKR